MSQLEFEKIENKFDTYRREATGEQWQDPQYIVQLADSHKNTDISLAYRLMQRAHNLSPSSDEIKEKLKKYREESEKVNPKAEYFKSKINKNKIKVKIALNAQKKIISSNVPAWSKKPSFLFVGLPWLLLALYFIIIASPRYESQAQLIVKQPDDMASLDASMAMLTGLGVPTGNTDTQLVEAYIYSNDMLDYLSQEINIFSHYSNTQVDFFSRIHSWSSKEDKLEFYLSHVEVEINDLSSVITIKVQAFDRKYAEMLNKVIVNRAEWYINTVGQNVAKEQLKFVQGEHDLAAKKLELAKSNLLEFQKVHNLLDPEVEGMAYQQIAYTLEGQISAKKAELYAMQSIMSDDSPKVRSLERLIEALEEQLSDENVRLTGNNESETLTVGEKVALFSEFKIDLEIALQSYGASLISLEKSRIEAYRKLQYLVVIESSTLPDENKYPEVVYNLTLFGVILLMIFGSGKIIVATIKELN